MNEEQISQPSDMADEQPQDSDAGTGAEMSADTDNSSGANKGTDASSSGSSDGAMADGGQTEDQGETAEASGNGLADQPVQSVEIEEASQAAMPEADSTPAVGEDIPSEAPAQAMAESEPAGDEPVAEQPLDNQPSGDEPAGDTAEQPIGEPPTRQQPMGEPPTGGPMGDRDGGPARFQRPYQDEGSDEAPPELVVRPARDPNMENVAPNASMEDLMKASAQQYRTLKHGDVLEGTVMKVDREEILLDIGAKTEGVIPSREATSMSEEERSALKVGDEVLVSVLQPENSEGHAVLSVDRARQERAWRDLHKQYEAGEIIQAQVVGHNKGGLLVNLEGIRGFVPSSQISSMPPGEANKQAELARLHGSTMPLKIIEINRNRNRLILSERQAMQEQRESMRSRLLQELEPGQIRPGTVTSICDFGAFVDIGGADGLIHLSELSWKRVSHPSELLKPGERIDVYVLSVDPNERKIALSLKRTQPEPWDTITDQYQLGQVVHGTITQITSFGAFARLEDGIEGLIHVSELAEGRVAHPRNVVKEGDSMDLKVIRIDPARKRIGLSLKRMNEDGSVSEGGEEGEGAGQEGASAEMRADTGGEGGESEGGYTPPTPSRERQFERGATQEREQRQAQSRQERQDRADRPQKAPVSSSSFDVPEDEAPSGALAAALAAHAQRGRTAQETEEEEATEASQASTKQTDVLTEPDRGADITDTLGDTEAAAEEGQDVGDAEAGISNEPEATMPSAADADEAASASMDASEEGVVSDSGATSGSEAMPSSADSAESDDTVDTTAADASDTGTDTGADVPADETSMEAPEESGETADDATADGDTADAASGEAVDAVSDTSGMENSDGGNYAENEAEAATDSQSDPAEMSSVAGSDDLGEEKVDKKKKS